MLTKTPTPEQLIDDAANAVRESLDELVKGVTSAVKTLSDRAEESESERDDLKQNLDCWDEEHEGTHNELIATLTDVKYWLHNVLVHGRPLSDPRQLMRAVERVLDDLDPVVTEKESETDK